MAQPKLLSFIGNVTGTVFDILYNAPMQIAEVENIANYTMTPDLTIVSVVQYAAQRYRVTTTDSQLIGVTYELEVNDVHSLIGSELIDPAYNTVTFPGWQITEPYLTMHPVCGTADISPRRQLRVKAVDQELLHAGVDQSTWNLSVNREADPVVLSVIRNGTFNTNQFDGAITGDGNDPDVGLTVVFRPKVGH